MDGKGFCIIPAHGHPHAQRLVPLLKISLLFLMAVENEAGQTEYYAPIQPESPLKADVR